MIDTNKYLQEVSRPGKFEGEPIATPYYFDLVMSGDGEPIYASEFFNVEEDEEFNEEDMEFTLFQVDAEEAEAFSLPIGSIVILWTDNQGFTMTQTFNNRARARKWIKRYLGA